MDMEEGNGISPSKAGKGTQGKEAIASQTWQAHPPLKAWWQLSLAQSTVRNSCRFFWGLWLSRRDTVLTKGSSTQRLKLPEAPVSGSHPCTGLPSLAVASLAFGRTVQHPTLPGG